jgi:ABC-2 type transport system ATP-binding protein
VGLARPDAGTIRIGGVDCSRDPKAAQHLIGIVPDESNLYPELTGFENLCFCGALYGMRRGPREERARSLLKDVGLAEAADRKFGGYSKGMKRRLTIAAGVIHDPPVLFLDEPTSGIDVASARQIRQMIAERHEAGTTVFLTTHYIEEAERLCNRIAFIVAGRIVRTDALEVLMQPVHGLHVMLLTVSDAGQDICGTLASAFPEAAFRADSEGQIRVESPDPIRVSPLVRFLEDQEVEVSEARKHRPTLEDVFVEVTGIGAAEMQKDRQRPGGKA